MGSNYTPTKAIEVHALFCPPFQGPLTMLAPHHSNLLTPNRHGSSPSANPNHHLSCLFSFIKMDPQNPQGAQQNRQRPVYDPSQGGHYSACAALASQGFAPSELYTGPWANAHQGLTGQYKDILTTYWQHTISHLENDTHDYKIHQLPLARIKKVMKADPEVKMISAEAPILFAKGCDIFITELTMRAWIHAEENKRRTLQRSDIASALAKSDMFDFLIDIVPREEASSHAKRTTQTAAAPQAVPAAPGQGQMPGQHANMPQAPNQPHPMGAPDYMSGHGLTEQDYRNQPNMYPGQAVPAPQAAYGQTQPPGMYGEMEGMYPYSAMPPQQAPMSSEEFE